MIRGFGITTKFCLDFIRFLLLVNSLQLPWLQVTGLRGYQKIIDVISYIRKHLFLASKNNEVLTTQQNTCLDLV